VLEISPEYGILKECWLQDRSTVKLLKMERTEPDGHRIHHQELGNPTCVIAAEGTALRNDDKKVQQISPGCVSERFVVCLHLCF
jgi:hypothetical protein